MGVSSTVLLQAVNITQTDGAILTFMVSLRLSSVFFFVVAAVFDIFTAAPLPIPSPHTNRATLASAPVRCGSAVVLPAAWQSPTCRRFSSQAAPASLAVSVSTWMSRVVRWVAGLSLGI